MKTLRATIIRHAHSFNLLKSTEATLQRKQFLYAS